MPRSDQSAYRRAHDNRVLRTTAAHRRLRSKRSGERARNLGLPVVRESDGLAFAHEALKHCSSLPALQQPLVHTDFVGDLQAGLTAVTVCQFTVIPDQPPDSVAATARNQAP